MRITRFLQDIFKRTLLLSRLKESSNSNFNILLSFVSGVTTCRYIQFRRVCYIHRSFLEDMNGERNGVTVQDLCHN